MNQRCKMLRCRDEEIQRYRCIGEKMAQMCGCADVQTCRTEVQRCRGADLQMCRHEGAEVQRCRGTEVQSRCIGAGFKVLRC